MKIFLSLPPFCLGWNSRPSLWIRMPNGPERRKRGRRRRRNKTIVHEQYSRVQYTQVRSSLSAEEIGRWNRRTAKGGRGEDSNWPSFTDEKIRREKKKKGESPFLGIFCGAPTTATDMSAHHHILKKEERKGGKAGCIMRHAY